MIINDADCRCLLVAPVRASLAGGANRVPGALCLMGSDDIE